MDPIISALGALVAILFGALGYFVRDALTTAKETAKNLTAFQLEVAKEYVSRDALKDMLQPIMDELEKIDKKLDRKADKP